MSLAAFRFLFMVIAIAAPAVSAAGQLTVSAAASLKAPFEEFATLFEARHPGMKVANNFAASGVLRSQIASGAPTDVFASASPREIESLEQKGDIVTGTRRNFAGNAIVLVTAMESHDSISSFTSLKNSGVRRIATGNPATVPAGSYAAETLKSLNLWEAVRDRLIYCEHVRQVADYVARGEVDAGIVFLTDAALRRAELRVVAAAPESVHAPVVYAIAVVRSTQAETAARDFIALVTSKDGKKILSRYGFRVTP